MALTPRSGFSITTSGQNDVPNEIPNTQADVLNNMPFITDTNLNKYAIDSSSYPNTTKMLVGFMKGSRVVVTYYRLLRQGGANLRTNIADLATARNVIDTEYQKILNLEITLPKEFDFEANPERATIGITGQAMLYPNMNPNVGDIFTFGLGDGRIGVFQIASVSPMSWRTDRIYAVTFVLQDFLDDADSSALEGSVTLVSVFSKENYLGGTAALLSENTYLNLQKIKAIRSNLCKFYDNKFRLEDLCSYCRPDGVYDAFVVRFMANKLSMKDVKYRPKLLTGEDISNYNLTIWSRLEDRYNNTLYGISSNYYLKPYQNTRMGVFVTELYGRTVVVPSGEDIVTGNTPLLSDSPWDPYIFSQAFYSSDLENMSPFEKLIYELVTKRIAGDLASLIVNYLEQVFSLSDDEQFYKIPLYIHLIDTSLQTQYREIDAPSMSYTSQGG